MLQDNERRAFSDLLDMLGDLYNRRLSVDHKRLYWAALRQLSFPQLQKAVELHLADPDRSGWMPKPGDILHQIQKAIADDGRPLADEAFAQLVKGDAFLETHTAIVTEEMQTALAAAAPLWDARYPNAAHKAFCAVYDREVKKARTAGKTVKWVVSAGHDAAQRKRAIEAAVHDGRLSPSDGHHHLHGGAIEYSPQITALLTGNVISIDKAAQRKRAQQLRSDIIASQRAAEDAKSRLRDSCLADRRVIESGRRNSAMEQLERLGQLYGDNGTKK
jgi:hypothetical protein